ncbi:uncharacterized protein LOC105286170 isoform X2 [Ooceraea biroi]|uniref:uncharacterized protein LOC105286170 isoform X2 n=1 Tax=Ooceraea biroi TaxID=2015173 RepID=UPI0005BE54EB|nr:uncharacterized protein LOC105286170 isoform X2 [Ooceraea biroi]
MIVTDAVASTVASVSGAICLLNPLNAIAGAMEFITLELRPRLQSCNVFIAVREEFRSKKNIEIKLLESNVILVLERNSVKFSLPFVKVIPTSLSALNVTGNWISFRLQMAPLESVFGSFNTEIVTDSSRTVERSVTRSPPLLDDIKLLFESSGCNILCTCCKSVISKSISFKRFLPLPDTEYDPDEWFCCRHTSKSVPRSSDVQPRETDYLYGFCFSVLHESIFADNVQVWNCCIDYKPCSGASSTVNATDPLGDFLMLVRVSLSEARGAVGEAGEIILQTSHGRRSHWLWIRAMDRKLSLMTEPSHGVSHDTNTDTIFLQQKYVAKVLYKYGASGVTTTASTIDNTDATYHESCCRSRLFFRLYRLTRNDQLNITALSLNNVEFAYALLSYSVYIFIFLHKTIKEILLKDSDRHYFSLREARLARNRSHHT